MGMPSSSTALLLLLLPPPPLAPRLLLEKVTSLTATAMQ
jgi:hypothetical protein